MLISEWLYRGNSAEIMVATMRRSKLEGMPEETFRSIIASIEYGYQQGMYGNKKNNGMSPEFYQIVENWVEMYRRLKV